MNDPLARAFGPVFAVEWRALTSGKLLFILRTLIAFALLCLFLKEWDRYRQVAALDSTPKMAEGLFIGVLWTEYVAIFLLTPILFVGAVAGERERKTLDLLLTTTLGAREILLGKSAARLAALLLVVATALPVVSLAGLLGGIDYTMLWQSILGMFELALISAAFSLYFSANNKTTFDALVRTYFWVLLWTVVAPIIPAFAIAELFWAVDGPLDPDHPIAAMLVTQITLSPLVRLMAFHDSTMYQDITRDIGYWGFALGYAVWMLAVVFVLRRAVANIRRPLARKNGWRISVPRHMPFQRLIQRYTDRAERRRRRSLSIDNPLWLRARTAPAFDAEGHTGRIQWLVGALLIAYLIGLYLFAPKRITDYRTVIYGTSVGWLSVALCVGMLSASGFVRDRVRGVLDLLLASPLSAREFIDGTFASILARVRGAIVTALLVVAFFSSTNVLGLNRPPSWMRPRPSRQLWLDQSAYSLGVVSLAPAIVSCGTALLFAAVLAMLGVFCSLPARKPASALACTLCLGFFAALGVVFVAVPVGKGIWIGAPVLLFITSLWVGKQKTTLSMGAHFFAVYYFLAVALTFWTAVGKFHRAYPALSSCPGYYVLNPIDPRRSQHWYMGNGAWELAVGCYWLAMLASLWWGRRYLIRNFDDVCGRTQPPT